MILGKCCHQIVNFSNDASYNGLTSKPLYDILKDSN